MMKTSHLRKRKKEKDRKKRKEKGTKVVEYYGNEVHKQKAHKHATSTHASAPPHHPSA